MKVRIESVKFDADAKLLEFTTQKVSKLDKFYDAIVGATVTFNLVPGVENKQVTVKLEIPGKDLLCERAGTSFEEAVVNCVDVLKESLKRTKEKMRD